MTLSRRTFLGYLTGLCCMPASVVWAGRLDQPLPPGGLMLAYAVMLGNDKVGKHSITINKRGGNTEIQHHIDISVTVAFITAYSLQHRSTEIWQGNDSRSVQLLSLESDTHEDGKHSVVKGTAQANGFVLEGPAGKTTAPSDVATTNSFWVDVTALRPHLIDSMDGELISSRVETLASQIESGKKKEHMRLHAGKQTAEAWFVDDLMVRGETVRKGHTIQLLPLH